MVFVQKKGTIEYGKLNAAVPLAIRASHLIVAVDGTVELFTDADTSKITMTVKKGSAKLSYNDFDFKSHVQTINENTKAVFDDGTRELVVE